MSDTFKREITERRKMRCKKATNCGWCSTNRLYQQLKEEERTEQDYEIWLKDSLNEEEEC